MLILKVKIFDQTAKKVEKNMEFCEKKLKKWLKVVGSGQNLCYNSTVKEKV